MNEERTRRYLALMASQMAKFLPENPQHAAEVLRLLERKVWRGAPEVRFALKLAVGASVGVLAVVLTLFMDWLL